MLRNLTTEEIENILSCVKPNNRIPEEIDTCNKENIKSIMRNKLEKIQIYPEKIHELKEKMENYYMKTQVPAGEMVGVLAATSIGEPTTQLALNSFHSSGIAKSGITTGVPRMQALMNTYKNTEGGIYLYLNSDMSDIKNVREICMKQYEYKIMKDFVESMKIVEVKNLKEEKEYKENQESWEDWHDYQDLMVSDEYKKCKWCIVITLKKYEMYVRNKKLGQFVSIIEKRDNNFHVISSSEEECILLVYVDTTNVKSPNEIMGMKKSTKKVDDELGIEGLITSENKDYYYMKDIVSPCIEELYVSGIKGVEACYYDQSPGSKDWKVETKGFNFRDILNHPMTDYKKTTSSDMWEIFNILGIEAARSFLINEFLKIIPIAKRHIIQLVNMMTFFGTIRGANRHGVNGTQVKTLSKITFEEPLKHIKRAALIGETEHCMNVSSQIMLGKTCKAGTGIVNLVYPDDMINFNIKNENQSQNKYDDFLKNVSYGVINNHNIDYKKYIHVQPKNRPIIRKKMMIMNEGNKDIKISSFKDLDIDNTDKDVSKDKKLSSIEGKESCAKKIGFIKKDVNKVKSRIFKTDENNLPLITEKNVDFL
jgi:hypothetical protein